MQTSKPAAAACAEPENRARRQCFLLTYCETEDVTTQHSE